MTIPTVSGGIFNFITSGYTPPVFSGAIYDFVSKYIRQVWIDENYVYAATTESLDIYDVESESLYGYITYVSGFTTLWCNDERVFLGTSNSGVKYINKTCISGSIANPYNLYICLNDLSELTPYDTTSSFIKYLHGYENVLGIITDSGIDIIKIYPQSYKSTTNLSGAQKCFMTSDGKFYYTVSGTDTWSLNRINTCLLDWDSPDESYITGSGILPSGVCINDIFVTEYTASDNISNTVFCATSSGVFVIDESTLNYDVYYITYS